MTTQIEKAAEEIVTYFVRNPLAADTLEGIARWRLMQQTIDRAVDETLAALLLLVERGVVEEVRIGTTAVFRLRRDGPQWPGAVVADGTLA